ncbi:hypothetical protein SAMN04515674_11295 [Pseudarcicella hirudinis]|uniref:Outer membrane protein beta-barrel domain-containing protein n=1 Tax=Pseudarcicella hirudinis TaxID=1079859 RepID=A0A1I5WQ75_9BACT|nr:hypothetical protein [Pseudarcicella hirudinis]SFQ21668.1 hypothetical protein SAMN04515674_11295 [Pseudarcicella hirudinis]
MKSLLLSIALISLVATSLFSQDLSGRRIISGSINAQFTSNSSTDAGSVQTREQNSNTVNFTLLTGKIKENNTYLGWGANIAYSKTTASGIPSIGIYSVGPAVEFGKFSKIFENFFFAPTIGGRVNYTWSTMDPNPSNIDTKGFSIGASTQLIRFMYQFHEKFLLSAGFGSASINYSHTKTSSDSGSSSSYSNFNISGFVSNSANFTVFYTF